MNEESKEHVETVKESVIRLRSQGKTFTEIAKITGKQREWISAVCHKHAADCCNHKGKL